MSQKTPMMLLKEKLEYAKKHANAGVDFRDTYNNAVIDTLENIINDIDQMIPVEKQCISDSFGCGFSDKYKLLSGEQYYNETFIEKKDTTKHLCNRRGELLDDGAYAD